jgi:hypothetical protein
MKGCCDRGGILSCVVGRQRASVFPACAEREVAGAQWVMRKNQIVSTKYVDRSAVERVAVRLSRRGMEGNA